MGRKIGAGISLFLFVGAGMLLGQEKPAPTQAPSQAEPSSQAPAESKDQAASATPDRAVAYYHYMLARRYTELAGIQNRGDYVERAVAEYKLAIAADPESLFLRVELAGLYARITRVADAVKEAEDVLKENPDQVDAHRLLAEIYFHSLGENQPEKTARASLGKAIQHLEAVTRLDPSDTNSWLMLGQLYRANNQTPQAEEAFKKALSTDPGSHAAQMRLAQLYADEGDEQLAIDLLNKIPDEERDSTVLGLLGYAYSQKHDYDHAVTTYQDALVGDPDNQDIRRAYAEALMGVGKLPEARAELEKLIKADPDDGSSYLKLAHVDRQEGKFDVARKNLEKAKSLMPDNLEVFYEQILLEDALGNEDTAIQLINEALKQLDRPNGQFTAAEATNRSVFLERLGLIYRSQEKFDQAIQTFKHITELGKSQAPRGEGLMVETLRLEGKPKDALAEAQSALQQYPDDRPLRLLDASLLGEQGHVDEAVGMLQKILTGKPDDVEVYRGILQIYSQAKRFPEAEAAAQKALEMSSKPDDQEYTLFLLGSVYEHEKRYDLAEQNFKKVLAADPLNAAAANYLGYMLADRGVRLDESVKYIQKALSLEPNNGAYLDSLGWAYLKMKRVDLAAPPLEKAAKLVSNDPTIHEHLGHLYLEMGKTQQAEEEWERALREWPTAAGSDFDADQAARLQKQLEELKAHKLK